jgi:hypothetical protein
MYLYIPFIFSTTWWDPIGNTCLCTTADCELKSIAVSKPNTTTTSGSNSSSANGGSSTDSKASGAALTSVTASALFAGLIVSVSQLL